MEDLESFTVNVDSQGRILIPSKLRKQAGIEPGCEVLVFSENGGIVIARREIALAQAQQIVARYLGDQQGSLVDELIAERRREAARESEKNARERKSA